MKVVVVEDLVALREYASRAIPEALGDGVQVILAPSATEALPLINEQQPELIVLDIAMPDISGIKLAEMIWATNPTQKILFWSQHHNEGYVRAISKILPDVAIHGYVLKGGNEDRLADALQALAVDDLPFIDPIVHGVATAIRSRDHALTDIEFETLLDVAVGLTDRAIAMRRHVSVRGVEKRISTLLEKLLKTDREYRELEVGIEVINLRTRLVCAALRRGLITADDLHQPDKELLEWWEDLAYRRS
ncbi:MAG: response regulator transcription factor [Candidatus Obscuribacterales bacterium]